MSDTRGVLVTVLRYFLQFLAIHLLLVSITCYHRILPVNPGINFFLGIGSTVSRKLLALSWERTLYNPLVRKLVNESSSVFSTVQARTVTEDHGSFSELIKCSHQYRCIMNACIEDLNQAADSSDMKDNYALLEMSEIFYKAELVWHLCEIIYLENPAGVLPHLIEWVRVHFPVAIEEAVWTTTSGVDKKFWKSLYSLVFQLRLDSSAKLLKLHPNFQTDAFQSAFELLKKMPVFSVRKNTFSFSQL